jgi:hypothetical protein
MKQQIGVGEDLGVIHAEVIPYIVVQRDALGRPIQATRRLGNPILGGGADLGGNPRIILFGQPFRIRPVEHFTPVPELPLETVGAGTKPHHFKEAFSQIHRQVLQAQTSALTGGRTCYR